MIVIFYFKGWPDMYLCIYVRVVYNRSISHRLFFSFFIIHTHTHTRRKEFTFLIIILDVFGEKMKQNIESIGTIMAVYIYKQKKKRKDFFTAQLTTAEGAEREMIST